jgi:hypothetical protein
MEKKEAQTTSPLVVHVEATPTLRFHRCMMHDCNLLSDPWVIL